MADDLSSAAAADLARDQTIVRVRFTRAGKEYRYALIGADIAANGAPHVGDKVHVPGTSCDPEVIGFGRNGYAGRCKRAYIIARPRTKRAGDPVQYTHHTIRLTGQLIEQMAPTVPAEMAGLAALVDSAGTLHGISPDAGTGVWNTYQETNAMNTDGYTCRKGLISNPVPDNDALIEQHQEAIAAIKARKKAAKAAEKAERKRQREMREAAQRKAERIELARQTLADIAADPKASKASRIEAATNLAKIA